MTKALLQLEEREPTPTRAADFVCLFPFQPGKSLAFSLLDGLNHKAANVLYNRPIPVSVSPVLGGAPVKLRGIQAADSPHTVSLADPSPAVPGPRLPIAELQLAIEVPAKDDDIIAPPPLARPFEIPPAAVERMVFALSNPQEVAGSISERIPGLALQAVLPLLSRAEQTRPLQVSTAPVSAQYVTPAATTVDSPVSPAKLLNFEIAAADTCIEPVPVPAPCEVFMPSPAAEMVAITVLAQCAPESVAFAPASRTPDLQLSASQVCANTTPFPVSDAWLPSPAAEPVAVEVISGFAHENCTVPESMLPDLRRFSIADPWMPMSQRLRPSLSAEPVSMTVWPLAAMAEESVYGEHAEPQLPGAQHLPDANQGSRTTPLQPAAAGLKPELVERTVLPDSKPVHAEPAGPRVLEMPAFIRQDLRPAAVLAGRASSLDAEPVETMPLCEARQATPIGPVVELRLPSLPEPQADSFAVAAGTPPMPAHVRVAPPAAVQHPVEVKPLPTLFVNTPHTPQPEELHPVIPAQGFVPLEFFSNRTAGTPSRKMVWCAPSVAPILPGFSVHPILDRVEKEPQQKKPKKPAFAEIFELPEAARQRAGNPVIRHAIKAIAACFLLGSILWFGLGTIRIGNQTPVANREVSIGDLASGGSSTGSAPIAVSPLPGGARSAAKPTGVMGRLRSAISDRAAVTVTDTFKNGMEAWGTAAKQWAPGWSRNPDGYVRTGQLALFRPTLNFKDYHMEFFGQIESRSMGWAVRAHDTQNYYGMKLTVIEPGLRPVIAMVHYPVVGGKRGRPVQIPLNVMVHNNQPLQVSVDVKGNKLLTSVDGQLVDTWVDDTLVAGGVGFFSEAGERARLYWMKISKNEDFLGRICAYVSSTLGDGSRASAELWPPYPDAPQHQPSMPEHRHEAALSDSADELQNRLNDRRTERWNS